MKVHIALATHKARIESLKQSFPTIYSPKYQYHVYLNDIEKESVPECLKANNVKLYYGLTRKEGNLADQGKFFPLKYKSVEGYYLTIDDDILYPPDYVENMIENIDKYNRQVIVAHHGRSTMHNPITSYYFGRFTKARFFAEVTEDRLIQFPGTGLTGFHTDTVKFNVLQEFGKKYMSDIWIAYYAVKNGIPVIKLKHNRNWLKQVQYYCQNTGIHKEQPHNEEEQIRIANEVVEMYDSEKYKKITGLDTINRDETEPANMLRLKRRKDGKIGVYKNTSQIRKLIRDGAFIVINDNSQRYRPDKQSNFVKK